MVCQTLRCLRLSGSNEAIQSTRRFLLLISRFKITFLLVRYGLFYFFFFGYVLYTYRYTVTTRMTSALRRAAIRAILMFH